MQDIRNRAVGKILSLVLVISILFGTLSQAFVRVYADEVQWGAITPLVDGGVLDGDTVTFGIGTKLIWSPQDASIGRWSDGWWVGIKVTAPESLDIDKAVYQNYSSDGWGTDKSFKQYRDSNDESDSQYITLWGIVNEGHLNDAIHAGKKYIEYKYQFDWDGDGVYEQPVTMRVESESIVLLDQNGDQTYPKSTGLAEIETITSGVEVNGNGSNIITIETNQDIVLEWVAANAEIGRVNDGWWIGYNVIAPEGFADNASYQHKTSTGWGDANSFNENKDAENIIGVWRFVNETYLNNAIANGKNVNYTTRYDWDGDGVYEQIVTLKIAPSKVTLIGNDGNQVYPYFGTVVPLTGGTVVGNTTNIEVVIEETVLNWSEKDPSIGRNSDGWWVGIKITAPEGYTAQQLNAAFYNRRYTSSTTVSGWSEYEKVFFKDARDSEREIQMWMVINPTLVEKYNTLGRNISSEFVFDWDGTGNGTQTITLTVVPSDRIVLNKVEQTGFAFAESNPTDKWVGETYTNTASGGNGTGTVTYTITAGNEFAEIDPETGALTFKGVGTVEVTAIKAADDVYEQTTAKYVVKSIKYPQTDFRFENSNSSIVADFASGVYSNTAIGGSGNGEITYSIISGESVATIDSNTGVVNFVKAGEIVVQAIKASDDNYTQAVITYTLVIEKSEQEAIGFDTSVPTNITYKPTAQNVISIAGGSGEGKVSYSIIDGNEFATVNSETGEITTLKAGGYFTVRVDKAGDEGYVDAESITATIYVDYASQTGFKFEVVNPEKITFNDNENKFSNPASGGESTGKITYRFDDADSDAIADIDEGTGEITILASGTINVVATKTGDDCYAPVLASYSLVIDKDTPEFEVSDVELTYGTKEYQINVYTILGAPTNYVYSIVGENNIGAVVDATTGQVSFENSEGKAGKITVNVQREADNKYKEVNKTFELTVSYAQTSAVPTVKGDTKNSSGWYTGNIIIKAPNGYTIAYDNKLDGTDWQRELSFDKEGINDAVVYLKNSRGYITDAIVLNDIKLDTGNPDQSAIDIEYSTPTFERILETISFGIYKSEKLRVTLVAKDETSGIASLTYNIGGEDVVVSFDGETATITHSFEIDAQFRNKITLTATDMSGRQTQKNSEHILVLDTKTPELTPSYEFASGQHNEDENGVYYTKGAVTVFFTINETNFDISDLPVITVNEEEKTVDWIRVNGTDNWKASFTLSTNGDYVVKVEFTDAATNKMDTYTKEIHIDNVAPVFTVTYDNNNARNDNNYNADRTATVQIKAHNFKPSDVNLTVDAKDITGVDVDIISKAYADYASNPKNWTREGDVWTLNPDGMKFDIDARYTINIEYSDLAGNAASPYYDSFVIDKTIVNADGITIEYSTPLSEKLLEIGSFGFYNSNEVEVTITVKDHTAGIEYFEITYNQADGSNNSNKPSYTTEKLVAVQDKTDKTVFTVTHTLSAQARGNISVELIDKAGNIASKVENHVIVLDTIAPGLDVEWIFVENQMRNDNDIFYTQSDAKVEFTITEANFDLSVQTAEDEQTASDPTLTVNGIAQSMRWEQIEGTDKWRSELTLTGDGDYVVELSYADRSTNAMNTFVKEVHIDSEAPAIDVVYDNNMSVNGNKYNADRVATIKIDEHNFKPEDVELSVVATNLVGNVDISSKDYTVYAKDPDNWTREGDVWTLNTEGMRFDIDAIYVVTLEYVDLAGNGGNSYTEEFVIDKTESADITIQYSNEIKWWEEVLNTITFGYYFYYDEKLEVTVIAKDGTSGIEYFEWRYVQEEGTSSVNMDSTEWKRIVPTPEDYSADGDSATVKFTINAQARGYIAVAVADNAGNVTIVEDNKRINVVDNITPTRVVTFSPAVAVLDAETMTPVDAYDETSNVILYYQDKAEVTIVINEANFYADDMDIIVIKNGRELNPRVEWTTDDEVEDRYIGKFVIEGDGDYRVSITDFYDRSSNKMMDYISQEIRIDSTVPEISVEYSSNIEPSNVKYYKDDRKAVITIVDHNFLADNVVAEITAKDVQGNDIENAEAICNEFAAYLKERSSWNHDGDVHTAEIKFAADAQYTFKISCNDIAMSGAVDYEADPFVVDHTAPTNLNINYSDSIIGKIINGITFGFYQPKVTVTITADDITSGIDFFEWKYTKEIDSSDINAADYGGVIYAEDITYSEDGLTATATFEISTNARGFITATATDKAGNSTTKTHENEVTVIVDNKNPTISVKYETDAQVQFTDSDNKTVEKFEDATIAYVNGNVTVQVVINEANFFEGVRTDNEEVIHYVGIKLTKTDDYGNTTVYEYLPKGSNQMYDGAIPQHIVWTSENDKHTTSISYEDNADYVLEIEYIDMSNNESEITANDGNNATQRYQSKTITVDKIAPIVSIEYQNIIENNDTEGEENENVVLDGRVYYRGTLSATITVEEHNFRAEDFDATVIAKDIIGNNIEVKDYAGILKQNWTQEGNVYTKTIVYCKDANYTFDYVYHDLARNAAEDFEGDLFTIDNVAPDNLTISYSQGVNEIIDTILETITFGYYSADVTVTVTADDIISGLYSVDYEYSRTEGASDINEKELSGNIELKDLVREGKTTKATFAIPKDILAEQKQLNGTVKFKVVDCSGNSTEMSDSRQIVVDNISPILTITYNAPVQTVNGISYYAGNIDVTVVVNEANFYSEDVDIQVNGVHINGENSEVKWENESVDVHTGTFTLSKDGDYVITLKYSDRSGNEMVDDNFERLIEYKSNQLTIDTRTPSISVTNIKNNSANKEDKYSFTITANDVNLNAGSFKPVLTATVRNEDGSYETKNVSLGGMRTIELGKTYSFVVDNLEEDGVYSLVCSVRDMSGNATSKILLGDGEMYDKVDFSINRNGSTFRVDEETAKLLEQHYVYSVTSDVVIEEINVDPVETYNIKVNGELLTAGKDYTTTMTNKAGEWSMRTYTIPKEYFDAENEYIVVVESVDKAGTTAFSDVKKLNITFVVDQTAPVLTISGLEDGGRYQVEEQMVTIIPTDDGGCLADLKVVVVDSDGNPLKDEAGNDISVRFDMSGEEFLAYLSENDGKVVFTVPQGLENQVKLFSSDCALNADGKTNEYTVTIMKVTVSQSGWVIFYANKPLFYGSVAGVAVVIAGLSILMILKKRRMSK